MQTNEKTDVYSFGVVALEVIMGIHPGHFISFMFSPNSTPPALSLSPHAIEGTVQLKDMVDPRLSLLHVSKQVEHVIKVALKCIHQSPQSRPTMRQVCAHLAEENTYTAW